MLQPAVEVRELTMRYSGRTVVDRLSMTAPAGALTVVLGPNGAGKTTTIETAEGFRAPQAGQVRVLGRDPLAQAGELAARVGVMLQAGGVWPALRTRDMLAHVARLHATPLPVDLLMERLGLATVARTPFRRLSGGEQQKLTLACALVGRPELVFLDEPTAGMDPSARASVGQFLLELRDAGVSIVMSTHLLDEAQTLADHVVVIDHGRVVGQGSVSDLTSQRPGVRFQIRPGLDVRPLGVDLGAGFTVCEDAPGSYRVSGPVTPSTVATVTAWCAAHGQMPTALTTEGATLSQAYFELTTPHEAHR